MKIFPFLCTLFLCTIVTIVSAQEQRFTLNDLYILADSNNRNLHIARMGMSRASEERNSAQLSLYPDLSLSLSASYLGNGYCWDRNFTNGFRAEIPHFGNNFSFEIVQVLYAGGALKNKIELSKLNEQMAELYYKQKRHEVRFLISGYFLDLYKMRNYLRIYEQNIELARKLIEHIAAKQEQGAALKNDKTRYELQLENMQLQYKHIENSIAILNKELTTALGLSDSVIIIPDTFGLQQNILPYTETEWQNRALENATTLKQANLAVDMHKKIEKIERSAMIPHISFVAQEHLDGPITIEIPTLNNNFNYWFVGVGIQYDFASLYKSSSKLKAAKINTMMKMEELQAHQENLNNSIHAAYIQLDESFTELETNFKTLELANLNYEVTYNRYENDLALLTDMLDASNTKLFAELELVNAKINIIYNYLRINYLCGKI